MKCAGAVVRGMITAAVLGLLSVVPASAQRTQPKAKETEKPAAAPAGTRIGVINSRLILQATPGWAQAESTWTRENEGYRAEVQKMQATLDSASADFDQQSVVLSPSQRQAKRTELEQQRQKLEQRYAELQQKSAQRQAELLDPLQQRVNAVIEGVRAEGNFGLIFDVAASGSGIVAVDRALDLTPRIIERLKSGN